MKSPCLGCPFENRDKNKCVDNCENIKEFQRQSLFLQESPNHNALDDYFIKRDGRVKPPPRDEY